MRWSEFIKKFRTGYPASIPVIVAHIQKYLFDNPIKSEEEIDEKIETEIQGATGTITDNVIDYLEEHPEILPTVTVDSELSTTSENPVQNKVIKAALDNIPSITVDDALSTTSENPVQNKVIKAALDNIPSITVDDSLSTTSENPVQNKVIKAALDNIPGVTVDDSLSTTSENPVQNKVITNALADKLTATEVVFNVSTWSNDAYWPSGNGTRPLGETANVCSRSEVTQDADNNAIVCSDGDGFVVEEWSKAKLPAPVWVYVDNNKIWVATRNTKSPSSQITIKGLILHR